MKKAQVWLMDFVFGFLLFILAFTISIKFISNALPNSEYEQVMGDAERISETFMSEGVPVNWTNNTVIKPGLLTNGKFDEKKFRNLSDMNYTDIRNLFNTKYDFYVFVCNQSENPCVILSDFNTGHGDVSVPAATGIVNLNNLDYDNLVRIERLVVMNSSIHFMVIYVWD